MGHQRAGGVDLGLERGHHQRRLAGVVANVDLDPLGVPQHLGHLQRLGLQRQDQRRLAVRVELVRVEPGGDHARDGVGVVDVDGAEEVDAVVSDGVGVAGGERERRDKRQGAKAGRHGVSLR
jgi:hypothetical protein